MINAVQRKPNLKRMMRSDLCQAGKNKSSPSLVRGIRANTRRCNSGSHRVIHLLSPHLVMPVRKGGRCDVPKAFVPFSEKVHHYVCNRSVAGFGSRGGNS